MLSLRIPSQSSSRQMLCLVSFLGATTFACAGGPEVEQEAARVELAPAFSKIQASALPELYAAVQLSSSGQAVEASVAVVDELGEPVVGVAVHGQFSGQDSADLIEVTDEDGIALFSLDRAILGATFTISAVTVVRGNDVIDVRPRSIDDLRISTDTTDSAQGDTGCGYTVGSQLDTCTQSGTSTSPPPVQQPSRGGHR